MSARVGIIAVRDLPLDRFLAAFPMLGPVGPSTANGWTWASFSLWAIGGLLGAKADEIFASLDRPALQAWTEDGALWYLALRGRDTQSLRHVHWFEYNQVAAGREQVKRGVTLKEYLDDYESDVPRDYRHAGPLPQGSFPRVMVDYLAERAGALSDFLAECGVDHDRDTMIGAITGESVTEEEWGWDVGNLPRFLDSIGLGDVFPDWQDEIEAERRANRGNDPEENTEPSDPAAPILERLGDIEPVVIRGGPITAPFTTLWFVPWACHTDVELAWIVRPSRPTKMRWPKIDGLCVFEHDGEWRIGLPWCSVWLRDRMIPKLHSAIGILPDGSQVELVAAAMPELDDDPERVTAGDMRFRGVIQNGKWNLTHAHPPISAQELEGALAVFDWIGGKGALEARDASEATAVVELGRKGEYFGDQAKDRPVVKGRSITVRSRQWRYYLALALFRHRFAQGPWDTISSQQASEKSAADFDQLITSIGAKVSQALAAPRDEALVHQGQATAFRRADITALKPRRGIAELFATLYPARDVDAALDLAGAARLVDESMATCGLAPIGDMVCEAFGEIVIRGYAGDSGDAHGLVYAGTVGQFAYEFNTQFTDGSSLTTSINPGKNQPALKSTHVQIEGASVEALWEKHRAGIAKRTRGKVKPAKHPRDLAALAARIDDFLMRSAA